MKMNIALYSVKIAAFTILMFYSHRGQAQTIHHFTEGLYARLPSNYGREAIYRDELLWHHYRGELAPPQEGRSISGQTTPTDLVWTTVTVDTSGFFRPAPGGENLRNPSNPAGPGRIENLSSKTSSPRISQRRGVPGGYLYLTYQSPKAQNALLNVKGNSAVLVNGELHAGDPYRLGWLDIPVKLKKGLNEFYIRGTFISAQLEFPDNPVKFSLKDPTLADIVQGKDNSELLLGLLVVNNSDEPVRNLEAKSVLAQRSLTTALPTIPPRSTRKVAVRVDASNVTALGNATVHLNLLRKGKTIDGQDLTLRSVDAATSYRQTFVSAIDGSVQYYAVTPATGGEKAGDALFLSVHGAGVEALGQAQAYAPKDWGTLVAPTNRRPRGFNWEDWGRIDALEVLALAKQTLQPDSQRIYLTGHSMGGHGTWFLGATYPDKWAAIAPCAGYPTLKGYGSADGIIPETGQNEMENILLRSSNQSDVTAYATNYRPLGVYVLHGDADRTVSVEYARQMRKILGEFHPDFSYYEYPGGSHWYSNESVDWKPLFDYFQWHRRKTSKEVDAIDFKTANPGISASYYWARVYQQAVPLEYSRIQLTRDLEQGTILGKTENTLVLCIDVADFATDQTIRIQLDSLAPIDYQRKAGTSQLVYLRKEGQSWLLSEKPDLAEKGPHRNGTFKEAFNHRMLYVYGTQGTKDENKWALEKANYDAESWYYRGNGSFDIIADHEYDAAAYADRNVILIGNSKTNSAWNSLLADCPIKVNPSSVRIADKEYKGTDIGGYFVWRKPGTTSRSVGAIAGTGIKGMKAATANQYFAGASGFPDYMFYGLDMLKNGSSDVMAAGFYNNQWQIQN